MRSVGDGWTEAELLQLPGGELVVPGMVALSRGEETVESLLVTIAARRLRAAGLDVPQISNPDPELRLFRRLRAEGGTDAYGRYNSLIRRLIRFEHAIEAAHARRARSLK